MHATAELNVDFPSKFQMHVRRVFDNSVLLLDAVIGADAAAQAHGAVGRFELKRFYNDLLDFDTPPKKPLPQLFRECFDDGRLTPSWVVVLSTLPPQFCD